MVRLKNTFHLSGTVKTLRMNRQYRPKDVSEFDIIMFKVV
jgi:hypothetical protein